MKNNLINIAQGNCQLSKPDCFHPNGLAQLGVNPYNNLPTISEMAFDGRYCCGQGGGGKKKLKSKKTSKSKKKSKNNKKKITKHKKFNKKGGQVGYYLDLTNNNNCSKHIPIVKSYNTCCYPVYNSNLLQNC